MAMRLQELHPSLVHFPIALFPVAIGADLLGRLTGSEKLRELGRMTMPLAAIGGAVAGVAGLIAQEEVRAEGRAGDMLTTHRNLNLALVAAATGMAAYRARTERPSAGYLALGLAGWALMNYTAYLGGHMVYEHGVGVEAADGVRAGHGAQLRPRDAARVARHAGSDLEKAIPTVADSVRQGDVAPSLTHRAQGESEAGEQGGR